LTPELAKATAHITGTFYALAIAVVAVGAISLIVAKTVGGKSRRQRQATAQVVFAIGMFLFAVFFLPRILGSGG
jgi:hypothetical protein